MHKVRRNAYRKIELGAIFLEEEGPHELVEIEVVPAHTRHPVTTYNYTLRPLTPDEVVVWEIHSA